MGKETEKQKQDANNRGSAETTQVSAAEVPPTPDSYEAFVPLSELNLSNGFLFGEVMRDEETCRTVLEIILRRPVGRVVYATKEKAVEAGTRYHESIADFEEKMTNP